MKLQHGGSHHRALAEINITPFVDVVLVLLIIFMITAPLLQQGMAVQLPKAQAPELERTPQDILLTIDNTGHIFVGDSRAPIPMEELSGKLAAVYQNRPATALWKSGGGDVDCPQCRGGKNRHGDTTRGQKIKWTMDYGLWTTDVEFIFKKTNLLFYPGPSDLFGSHSLCSETSFIKTQSQGGLGRTPQRGF